MVYSVLNYMKVNVLILQVPVTVTVQQLLELFRIIVIYDKLSRIIFQNKNHILDMMHQYIKQIKFYQLYLMVI
jgi:hypothetical protein